MAQTSNTYTVGSSGQAGPYSYAFPLINTTDLVVSVNGTIKTVSTDFTVDATNSRITFVSGKEPGANDTLILYRKTDEDPINTVFVSGSTVRAQELNDNFRQLLYISQETADQALSSLGSTLTNAKLNGALDADNNKIINVADGTDTKDAVNKGQLDAAQTANDAALTTAVANAQSAETNAAASATSAATSATTASNSATFADDRSEDAQKFASNPEDQLFSTYNLNNQYSALHYAEKASDYATQAGIYASKTYFYGFKNDDSDLSLVYSGSSDNATYSIADHKVKGGTQWWIGFSDVLDGNGVPKYYFDWNGKVMLETYNESTVKDDVGDDLYNMTSISVSNILSSPSQTYYINKPGDYDYFELDWAGISTGASWKLRISGVNPTPVRDLGVQLRKGPFFSYTLSSYYMMRINDASTYGAEGVPNPPGASVTGHDGDGKSYIEIPISTTDPWTILMVWGIGHTGRIGDNPAYLGGYNIQIIT